MSCCPPVPPIKVSDGVGYANAGQESVIQPGESVECYAARSGNSTGKQDDATQNIPGKIENTSIPIDTSNASVNVTFRLTTGSPALVTPSWTGTFAPTLPPGVGAPVFTSNGATAALSGTFPANTHGTSYTAKIEVFDGATLIDSRTFTFSPAIASQTDSIRLVVPLPGGIVNSKFGPRLHPKDGVQKMHNGIDMKMNDRSVVDVVSAADGEVTFAGLNGTLTSGYGNCIKIQHKNGAGKLLCTTLYGHLAKLYVAVGQKVSAGQKIGLEGTTGSSTGNHLHFEVRLPNNTPVDPVPYIRGTTTVSDETTPTGDPAGAQTPSVGKTSVTPAEVEARTGAQCPASGVDPQTGAVAAPPATAPAEPPVIAGGDPFEYAWYFTMTFEVGKHWKTTPPFSPGDPELDAGLFDTDVQRKKVGYKPGPNFPGGETKFGVAQNPNKSKVVVKDLTYGQAKTFGKNGYWGISGTTNCNNLPPLVAIMVFDMNYLHGPGNARKILSNSGHVGISPSADGVAQLAACADIHTASLNFLNGMNPAYINGWVNRANARFAYVKSLTLPLP